MSQPASLTIVPLVPGVPLPRALRRPALEVTAGDAPVALETRRGLAEWGRQLAANRSAYKGLARSRQGRVEPEPQPGSGDGSAPAPDETE